MATASRAIPGSAVRRAGRRSRCPPATGDVQQARVDRLAQDLALRGDLTGDDLVAVPLEVVAPRSSWPAARCSTGPRPQMVLAEWSTPLDRQRLLVLGQIVMPSPAFFPDVAATSAKPCSRSQIRSSTDSVPDRQPHGSRPDPSRVAARCRPAGGASCWPGGMIRLLASPTLARWDQSVTPRMRSLPAVPAAGAVEGEHRASAPGQVLGHERPVFAGREARVGHRRGQLVRFEELRDRQRVWTRGGPSAATASPAPAGTGRR